MLGFLGFRSSAFFRNTNQNSEEEEERRYNGMTAMRAGVKQLMKRPAVDMSLGAIVVLDSWIVKEAKEAGGLAEALWHYLASPAF